jgi:hypothetical protein
MLLHPVKEVSDVGDAPQGLLLWER